MFVDRVPRRSHHVLCVTSERRTTECCERVGTSTSRHVTDFFCTLERCAFPDFTLMLFGLVPVPTPVPTLPVPGASQIELHVGS